MQIKRRFVTTLFGTASALLTVLFLGACQTAQQPTAAPETKVAPTTQVHVIFEGPWAIVPDPKDANSVLALAPKTKSHRPLGLVPANKTLEPGVYDLQVPAHSSTAPVFDKNIFRANVDPQIVQRALDTRLERYAIRLPRPEAYVAETRYVSRVGATYPPDVSTEMPYVSSISLRYTVSSLAGFSLAGTQDTGGTFNPQLLSLDTPTIRFEIDPAEDTYGDPCYTHVRQAFRDVTHLIGLTLYIDFPDSPADCHKKDPQVPRAGKASLVPGLGGKHAYGLFGEDIVPVTTAGFTPDLAPSLSSTIRNSANRLAAFYFFATGGGGCKMVIIVGGGG
jgi:hypothetical protein